MEQNSRPFLTARKAAEILGVPETAVIDDIQDGMDGGLPALIGGRFGSEWVCYAWQLEDEHIERHRARLARASTSNLCAISEGQ